MVYSAIYISSYWNRYPKMNSVPVPMPKTNDKNNLEQVLIHTDFGLS